MEINDGVRLVGRLQVFLNDKKVVDDKNLVTDLGCEWAAKMLGGIGKPITKMIIGDNSAAAQPSDTGIVGTKLGEVLLTNPGGDVYVNTIEYIATATAGVAVGPVCEVVMANVNNEMFARKGFAVVNKGPTDVMSFIWTVTVLAG